jgi:hypothetical protein
MGGCCEANDTELTLVSPNDEDKDKMDFSRILSRKCAAAELTHHLHLEDIDAIYLSTVVKSSGLVTQTQLHDAYENQAITSRKKRGTVWRGTEPNGKPHKVILECTDWSKDTVTDTLDCRALQTGIHTWSIKAMGHKGFELGVVSTRWPIDNSAYLFSQEGSRILDNSCSSLHAGIETQSDL